MFKYARLTPNWNDISFSRSCNVQHEKQLRKVENDVWKVLEKKQLISSLAFCWQMSLLRLTDVCDEHIQTKFILGGDQVHQMEESILIGQVPTLLTKSYSNAQLYLFCQSSPLFL